MRESQVSFGYTGFPDHCGATVIALAAGLALNAMQSAVGNEMP
jgi:hypothetical protein